MAVTCHYHVVCHLNNIGIRILAHRPKESKPTTMIDGFGKYLELDEGFIHFKSLCEKVEYYVSSLPT